MKRMLMTATITFSVMLLTAFQNKTLAQPPTDDEIDYQTFYDELDPHGDWMDYQDYGYVWRPNAGPDFQPYSTSGHWVWSDDYEWMWVSDYDWGWAPFHYGRWMHDPYYGWMWVPGYEWSPAWVAWRDGGDYYGWAPLRPGINISINFNIGGYNPPIDYWCFTPRRYITSPRLYDYCAPRRNNITIINQTTIINNYNYNRNVFRTGPGRRQAEQYTGRINPVRFRQSSTPGRTGFRNNEVSMYRPRVRQENGNRSIAPRRFERATNNGVAGGRRENGNNLPQRREGNINRPERNNNDRPSRNENGIVRGDRNNGFNRDRNNSNTDGQPGRRFERPERNNNGNTTRPDINRPDNRPNIGETRPSRPNRDRNLEAPQRNFERPQGGDRPQRNFERPQPQQNPNVNNDRRPERRSFGGSDMPRPERRQMGGGGMDRPQRQPQVQQQQPRQEQPRQFRSGGSENRGGGSGNRGGGSGRNRER